jgi:hypothetical protein
MATEIESNGSIGAANLLTANVKMTGQASSSSDLDYFKLYNSGSGTSQFTVNLPSTYSNYYIKIYDNTGTLQKSYTAYNGSVTYTVPSTSVGYSYISINSGSTDDYSITANFIADQITITPSYKVTTNLISINEGSIASFTLTTTNVASGTSVPYTLSGISAADVSAGSLSGNAVVNSSGIATISVSLLSDLLTEGSETLTVTAGGSSASTVVNDTSISALVDDYPWSTGTNGILNTSGTTLNGNIEINDDYDLFKVNLTAGSTYTIDLVSQTTAGLTNPFLLLYDPSVTFLLEDDNSGGGFNSRINFKAETSGTYYVGVRHSTLTGTGGYKVSVKLEYTPTYALAGTASSVNEGSIASFTLTTTNVVSGTSVPYTISGISAADVSGGSLSGYTVVSSSGVATISVSLLNDSLTEGSETLTVTAGGATASTVINDTSKASALPTYSLTATTSSFNEGSTATFLLNTTNVAAGTSVSYNLSGVSTADLAFGSLNGTTIVANNGQATITVLLANDNLTEGTETLTVTAGGASASASINDTSKSVATYSLSANSTSVNEGATATFLLTTTNVAAGTTIGYNLSGISVGDLSSGSLSGTTTIATNGQASITINLANDNVTEGTETLTVLAQGQTASTLVNDTSKSNTSTFPTVLTQQQMQNAPALAFTAFTSTDPSVKWNFSSFFFGTNLLGKDFNTTSFYASASSIYDFNALSIDDPDYLAIFDSNGNLISYSSETKDWAAWEDSSGKSYDYDNIFAWSPPKDGTYYLGVVLSQTSSSPFYSFGGYETRATVTSIPFGNGKYFYGSSGPDNVVGTSYVDVLKQTSTSASNQLTKLADGSWQVQNKLTASNSDNLVNVERIEFSDMSVALDVSGPAGQVAKILGSVFGKSYVSNTVFAGIGFAYLDGGMSYLDLCGLAAGAAGLSTPDLLVTTLLRNTTGTEPTALSKSSYLQSISNGASYASVVQQIADSSANAQSIKLTDLANTGLAYTPYVLQPTYSLSASTASVNEGSTAVFNLTTTNVAVGTEVSYTLSGISPSDLTSSTLTGKVTIGVGGVASINIPIAADSATEGQETLTVNAQGASATMVINDTSKGNATPTYSLTPATNSVNEGVLAQVYVSTTNVAAGTSLLFSIGGIGITQGDVIEGLSRFVTVDSTGKAVIDINTIADQITEGPETMYITLGTSTTSFIINDTSVTLVGVVDNGGGDGGGGGGGGGAGGD